MCLWEGKRSPVLLLHHLLSLFARHPFAFLEQESADVLGPEKDWFQLHSNDPPHPRTAPNLPGPRGWENAACPSRILSVDVKT